VSSLVGISEGEMQYTRVTADMENDGRKKHLALGAGNIESRNRLACLPAHIANYQMPRLLHPHISSPLYL
jgi:hypothetical protein